MRIVGALGAALAGLFAIGAVTAYGQIDTRHSMAKRLLPLSTTREICAYLPIIGPLIRCGAAGQRLQTTVRVQSSCTRSMHRPEPSPRIARTDTFPTAPVS
jgi:hypothetical protein